MTSALLENLLGIFETWVWPLLATFITVIFIYVFQRPRIVITVQKDEKPNLDFGAKFVHLFITNKSAGLLGGGIAMHCSGTIIVNKPDKKHFITKWATKRDPILPQYICENKVMVDLVGIEESKFENIYPRETKRLDVAMKWKDDKHC